MRRRRFSSRDVLPSDLRGCFHLDLARIWSFEHVIRIFGERPPDNPFAIDQELAEQLTASLVSHLLVDFSHPIAVPGIESRCCDDGNLALQAALNLGEIQVGQPESPMRCPLGSEAASRSGKGLYRRYKRARSIGVLTTATHSTPFSRSVRSVAAWMAR